MADTNKHKFLNNFKSIRYYNYDGLINIVGHITHSTKQGETIMTIARYYYGDSLFYFIIASANRLYNEIFFPFDSGIKLTIPNKEIINYVNKPK